MQSKWSVYNPFLKFISLHWHLSVLQTLFCFFLPLSTPFLPFHSPSLSALIFSFPISHSVPLSLSLFLFGIWKSSRHPREEELMLHNFFPPQALTLTPHDQVLPSPCFRLFFSSFLSPSLHSQRLPRTVLLVRREWFVLNLPLVKATSQFPVSLAMKRFFPGTFQVTRSPGTFSPL